jgi:hypothetical protein
VAPWYEKRETAAHCHEPLEEERMEEEEEKRLTWFTRRLLTLSLHPFARVYTDKRFRC